MTDWITRAMRAEVLLEEVLANQGVDLGGAPCSRADLVDARLLPAPDDNTPRIIAKHYYAWLKRNDIIVDFNGPKMEMNA